LVLHEGRIALEGSPAEVFDNVPRLQEWGIGLPQLVELAHLLSQRTGQAYHFTTTEEALAQLRPEVRVQSSQPPVASLPRRRAGAAAAPVQISVENVSYTYDDGTAALQGVSLTVSPGEFVALLGPNGSGKTTLAKHFDGLLRPGGGRVLVEGRDTRQARVAELARTVGYVFQNPDHQIFAPSVQAEVGFGLRIQGVAPAVVAQRVADALDQFRLTRYADQPPASLGYGQRRQVALAAVMATRPKVLILDEPTGGLDRRSQQELMEAVASFNALGNTVMLITHDMALVAEYATRAVVLLRGRILYDATPSRLFNQPEILEQAELAVPPTKRLADRLGSQVLAENALTPAEFVAAWSRSAAKAGWEAMDDAR
jgi:energy-coupling factor transporter ATP-binding protein EcfA2